MVSRDGKNFEKIPGGKVVFDQPGEFHFFCQSLQAIKWAIRPRLDPYTVIIDNQPPKSVVKTNEKLVEKDGVFISGAAQSD